MTGQERNERVIEEFKRKRTRQLISIVPGVAVLLIALSAYIFLKWTGQENLKGWAGGICAWAAFFGLISFAGAQVFWWSDWRCPACNSYLRGGVNLKFCSRCGTPLR